MKGASKDWISKSIINFKLEMSNNEGIREAIQWLESIDQEIGDDVKYCLDHSNEKRKVPITRYCYRCEQAICPECLIESHIQHHNECKIMIEDYMENGKLHLKQHNMKFKDQYSQSSLGIKKDIDLGNCSKIIEEYFNRRVNSLEIFKAKIDNLIENEKEIKNLMLGVSKDYHKKNAKNGDDGEERLLQCKLLFFL
jgi:hypothetical protein